MRQIELVKPSAHDRIMADVAGTLPMQSNVREIVVSEVVIAENRRRKSLDERFKKAVDQCWQVHTTARLSALNLGRWCLEGWVGSKSSVACTKACKRSLQRVRLP